MSRPVPLDLLFPRPVLVTLAGEPFAASELTLGDLALLQSWLRQAAPHPLRDLPPPWADPEPGTRRARLVDAWHAAKAWPPAVGDGDDAAYLGSPEGRAVFLVLVLGKHDESFTAERAAGLVGRMSAADWAALRRVAWGVPPWRELAGELDDVWAEHQARRSEPADWGELVVEAVRDGHDFATLAGWTLTQFRLFRSGGKADEYRAVQSPGESREAFEARLAETFAINPPPG